MLCFAAFSASAQSATPNARLREYIDYALSHDGNAERGRRLFTNEQGMACSKCHSVDGSSKLAGPDLFAAGDKFQRPGLIRAVLEPSAEIAIGFATTLVETRDDQDYQGILKQATDSVVELMLADGSVVRVNKDDIKEQRASAVSLMPDGWEQGITAQEFTDLVAYLETLRQPRSRTVQGAPETIAIAAGAAQFESFFKPNIRFRRPSWFGIIPAGPSNAFLVLEDAGRVTRVLRHAERDERMEFLDLTGRVHVGGGSGLLALAFHPRFSENRKYYLVYQARQAGKLATWIIERQFTADFAADAGIQRDILSIPSVTQDHTGGGLLFGPDGYLYIGMGDSGPQRDPQGHGQRMDVLLGKVLRIDVDRSSGDRAYSIPSDNPFVNTAGARPEIWALGFREPWRMSFEPSTRDLWVGDVGQDQVEEITLVRAGENHGWNVFEGHSSFSDRYRRDGDTYVAPVFSYPHRTGVSVTGGYVYQGRRAPALKGYYICGDFESRRLWALTHSNRVLQSIVEIGRAPSRVVSFTEDAAGELYVVGYDSGEIYRLVLDSVDVSPLELRTLAETAEKAPVFWRYSFAQPDSAAAWFDSDFNDSAWARGPGGFGTRGTPGAMVRTEWRSRDIWLRREFTLPLETSITPEHRLALRLHHDGDVEVYLNGVEAVRLPRWTSGYTDVTLPLKAAQALRPGRNVIAIHCRQNSGGQYIDAGLVQYVRPGK